MEAAPVINILIADDHQMILDGIKDMLAAEPAYTVAGAAPDGAPVVTPLDRTWSSRRFSSVAASASNSVALIATSYLKARFISCG